MDRALVKQVGILASSQLMLNLGFSQMVPVMPMFAAQMGGNLGATGVGLILSAPSAATLLLNVPLGRLCDVVGRKPLMWCGTALTAVGTTLTGFVGSIGPLIACRLLVGAGSASSMTGASAYISDISDRAPEHRAKIMGVHQAIVGSVWVVGPAVGGYLAETYGYRNSFLIAGVCATICSLGYTQLPETLQKRHAGKDGGAFTTATEALAPSDASGAHNSNTTHKDGRSAFRKHLKAWMSDVRTILASRNQQALIALACELPIRFSCFTTAVAIHASNVAGAGPKELGMLFTALALSQGVGMPIGSWLADRTSGAKKWMIVPGGLISSASFATLAFATSQEQLLAAMALQGFCGGFYRPAIGAFTAEVTPPNMRGQAMSLQRQAGSTLSLMGPITMGLIADMTSCPTAICIGSAMMMVCHASYAILATGDEANSDTKKD
mmetsp:Transcript_10172/g.25003  ORF Transcript_10172/g.25003 Transcript_10172/m.25003 type:complete len:439 (+) Transcript_10172:188-1504(+)